MTYYYQAYAYSSLGQGTVVLGNSERNNKYFAREIHDHVIQGFTNAYVMTVLVDDSAEQTDYHVAIYR